MTQERSFIPATAALIYSLSPVLGGIDGQPELFRDSAIREASINHSLFLAAYVKSFLTEDVLSASPIARRFSNSVDETILTLHNLNSLDLDDRPRDAHLALAVMQLISTGYAFAMDPADPAEEAILSSLTNPTIID